jgi:hypothetical protein
MTEKKSVHPRSVVLVDAQAAKHRDSSNPRLSRQLIKAIDAGTLGVTGRAVQQRC